MTVLFPIIFVLLFISVFVWFALCHKLFKKLEADHPKKYEEMGKPSLIMNNSISNNLSFMKFLFKQEYLDLSDPAISGLGKFMRVFLVVYSIGFLVLFLGVLGVGFRYAP